MFMACSDKLEKEAKKQMETTILNLAKDPNAKISDIKTTFKADSLIVMNCVVRGLNALGGYARNDMEYVYAIRKDGMCMELVRNLDNEESVLNKWRIFTDDTTTNDMNHLPTAYMKRKSILKMLFIFSL